MDIKTYISSGIIEAYALGVLSQEECSILECVMKNNIDVKNAVLETQKTFELLADAEAISVPLGLKNKISAKLEFSAPNFKIDTKDNDATQTPTLPLQTSKRSSGSLNKMLLLAASVLLLLSLGYNFYFKTISQKKFNSLAQNTTILENQISELKSQNALLANAQNIKLKGVEAHPGMLANVYWDASKKVYLKVNNLPNAPAGQQYQLWAIVDGKPVSAGMFDSAHPDKIQMMSVIDKAQAFAITLEKAGGSETPTMQNMMVMGTT